MNDKSDRKRTVEDVLQLVADYYFEGSQICIDTKNLEDDTPLHLVTWRRDAEAVDLLIEAGANVNAPGDMGQTPLHVAIYGKDKHIISSLVNAGARVDIRSEFGVTPAEKAMAEGGEVEQLFRQLGAIELDAESLNYCSEIRDVVNTVEFIMKYGGCERKFRIDILHDRKIKQFTAQVYVHENIEMESPGYSESGAGITCHRQSKRWTWIEFDEIATGFIWRETAESALKLTVDFLALNGTEGVARGGDGGTAIE